MQTHPERSRALWTEAWHRHAWSEPGQGCDLSGGWGRSLSGADRGRQAVQTGLQRGIGRDVNVNVEITNNQQTACRNAATVFKQIRELLEKRVHQ